MMTEPCILLVDDEAAIRKFLRVALSAQGYRLYEAGCAQQALQQAALQQPDLMVLDLGLPDLDGQQLLQQLRQWSAVPVLVLSARADEADKVQALDAGANDYLSKPFGLAEFLARVRALLRNRAVSEKAPAALTCGALRVDFAFRRVSLGGQEVSLTRKEYAVLEKLARHPGRVVTQQQLLRDIWGPSHTEHSHYLRIVIGHLRHKFGDDPAAPRLIITEAGVGYRLLGQD